MESMLWTPGISPSRLVSPTVGFSPTTQFALAGPRIEPTVSTPITWEEVEAVTDSRDPEALVFSAADVIERVAEHGDLFAGVVELRQELPDSL